MPREWNRRQILAQMASLTVAGAAPKDDQRSFFDAQNASAVRFSMQYRLLGRTGEKVSCLGLGGSHIGGSDLSTDEGIQLIRQALDGGAELPG